MPGHAQPRPWQPRRLAALCLQVECLHSRLAVLRFSLSASPPVEYQQPAGRAWRTPRCCKVLKRRLAVGCTTPEAVVRARTDTCITCNTAMGTHCSPRRRASGREPPSQAGDRALAKTHLPSRGLAEQNGALAGRQHPSSRAGCRPSPRSRARRGARAQKLAERKFRTGDSTYAPRRL